MKLLPVFLPENKQYSKDALKGIELRFANASNSEIKDIHLTLISAKKATKDLIQSRVDGICKAHIGIGLFNSVDTGKIKIPTDFLLVSPITSKLLNKDRIMILIISDWEVEAIRHILENTGLYVNKEDALIISDCQGTNPYLALFQKIAKGPIHFEEENILGKISGYGIYLVVGENKLSIIKKLQTSLLHSNGNQHKIIVTTSSFENWQIPPPIRKNFTQNVIYSYPRLTEKAQNIIDVFEDKFGYRPSIFSLLVYDAADIVIRTIAEMGPDFNAISKFLLNQQFDTLTMGKIGFNQKYRPHLIGRNIEDMFEIRYVDEKGIYRKEKS